MIKMLKLQSYNNHQNPEIWTDNISAMKINNKAVFKRANCPK